MAEDHENQERTNAAGGSSAPKASPAPEEEARIIEETIIRPAKPAPPQQQPPMSAQAAAQPPPQPQHSVPALPLSQFQQKSAPPKPTARRLSSASLAARGSIELSSPVPKSASIPPPHISPAPPKPTTLPQPTLPEPPKTAPELPRTPPTPSVPEMPKQSNISTEAQERISHILEETKLPEERGPIAHEQASAQTFDTKLGTPDTRSQNIPKAAEAPHQEAPPKEENPIVSPVRTLKNDLQSIVREKKISLVRAAALEQEKRHGKKPESPERTHARSHTRSILVAAALLFALGGSALAAVFFLSQEQAAVPESTVGSSILFAENMFLLPLQESSPSDTKNLVASTRSSGGGTLGSITRFVPVVSNITSAEAEQTQVPLTFGEFMASIGARTPPDLLRALGSEFFFGIHTVDENAPLFVVSVASYERAFAGMLAWEDTMNVDLAPIFTLVPSQTLGTSGLLEKRRFEDVVMRNYDVRALKDDQDTVQLYYAFPSRSILIIGENPFSFTEILNRLRAERAI